MVRFQNGAAVLNVGTLWALWTAPCSHHRSVPGKTQRDLYRSEAVEAADKILSSHCCGRDLVPSHQRCSWILLNPYFSHGHWYASLGDVMWRGCLFRFGGEVPPHPTASPVQGKASTLLEDTGTSAAGAGAALTHKHAVVEQSIACTFVITMATEGHVPKTPKRE